MTSNFLPILLAASMIQGTERINARVFTHKESKEHKQYRKDRKRLKKLKRKGC